MLAYQREFWRTDMRYMPAVAIALVTCIATMYALYLTRDLSALNGLWALLLAVWAANRAVDSQTEQEHERSFWGKGERQSGTGGASDI